MRIATLAATLFLTSPAWAQAEDERLLVVSAKEHALILLDPANGEREALFRVGLGPQDVAVSPNNRIAVVTNRGDELSGTTITVLDLAGNKVARTIILEARQVKLDGTEEVRRYHRPTGVAFLGGDSRVLVGCAGEGALLLVDLERGAVTGELRLDTQDPSRMVVGHDGRHAFVTSATSGTVSVVDTSTMSVVGTIESGGGSSGITLHPKKNEAWVTNTEVNTISVIDTEAMEEVTEFPCGAMPSDVSFTLDGKFALVTNLQEGNISVFDSESRRVHTVVRLENVPESVAAERPAPRAGSFGRSAFPARLLMHPSGKKAYVSTTRDDGITEIDLVSWRTVRRMNAPQIPAGMAWSAIARTGSGARQCRPRRTCSARSKASGAKDSGNGASLSRGAPGWYRPGVTEHRPEEWPHVRPGDASILGVDGCRSGWVVARCTASDGPRGLDPARLRRRPRPRVRCGGRRRRRADRLSRTLRARGAAPAIARRAHCSGGRAARASSPAPARAVLGATDHADATARNLDAADEPVGVTLQTFNIVPKLREVDAALERTNRPPVLEVHPELSFMELAGEALAEPKRSREGLERRVALLETALRCDVRALVDGLRGCARDDVVDALAVCWSAARIARGEGVPVPVEGPRDPRGLVMQIWR